MSAGTEAFHFAEPLWLWALLVPAAIAAWQALTVTRHNDSGIERYADAHLLPHLVSYPDGDKPARPWRRFALWTLIWTLAVLAMAGPRWDYTDARVFKPGADLLLLVDLSRSMEAQDVLPSRLGRARQEIEDLLALNPGFRVGLMAFASVAHVVAPITEDYRAVARFLPALSSDLVQLPGSRPVAALQRAENLLAARGEGGSAAILLVTDGDLVEPGIEEQVRALAARGIRVHVLGIGTAAGAQVPTANGQFIRDYNGRPVVSALNEPLLQQLASAGGGIYRHADYRDDDVREIVAAVAADADAAEFDEHQVLIWNERFHWLVFPAMLLLLVWFRRRGSAQPGVRATAGAGR